MSVITVKLIALPQIQVTATNKSGSTTVTALLKRGP